MKKTLAIRLDTAQHGALTERAKAPHKTRSRFVRELIDRAIGAGPMHVRVGHLKGRLKLRKKGRSGWPCRIRRANWR